MTSAGTIRLVSRLCGVGLLAVLCFLAGFSLITERHLTAESTRVRAATSLGFVYADARFWISQEESLDRKYRLEPGRSVLALRHQAADRLVRDLHHILRFDQTPAARATVRRLLREHASYQANSETMFRAANAAAQTNEDVHPNRAAAYAALALTDDHTLVDPLADSIASTIYARSHLYVDSAMRESAALPPDAGWATRQIAIAFVLGLALLLLFSSILLRLRRRVEAGRQREMGRLAAISSTDSLTGLRNHRAFHEDLVRELARTARTGAPVALAMLDLDGLKAVNDSLGHQAGDERLTTFAEALLATVRGSDSAYRVGGDEFAVILAGERSWGALELVNRLQATLRDREAPISVTAGITDATTPRDRDSVIREADLALITTKQRRGRAAIYTPELEPATAEVDLVREQRYANSLAGALAHAVDAKDPRTRSHSQTVSQLCVMVATELGFEPRQLGRIRVAGLLHDVGKIGIPGGILQKPARLIADEYEQMKHHPVLGAEIVRAANFADEARWVRHHHERFDGSGYPDGLAGEQIPLESRIILVADAFEAITADRPYRTALGRELALAELHANAGSQFDPRVVEAFCRALGAGGDVVERLIERGDESTARVA